MLILTRRVGTSLAIFPFEGLPPETPIRAFQWPAHVVVLGSKSNSVRVGVEADPRLVVLRDDLLSRPPDEAAKPAALDRLLTTALGAIEQALWLAKGVTPEDCLAIEEIYRRLLRLRTKRIPTA